MKALRDLIEGLVILAVFLSTFTALSLRPLAETVADAFVGFLAEA